MRYATTRLKLKNKEKGSWLIGHINRELLCLDDSDREKVIDRLLYVIREFKAYDSDRNSYVRKLQNELELYSEKYLYLKKLHEGADMPAETEERLVRFYERKAHLKIALKYALRDRELLDEILERCANGDFATVEETVRLKAENKLLRKQYNRYKTENRNLVNKLVELMLRLGIIESSDIQPFKEQLK